MAFFDQYKAINRNAISKDDKLTTKQDLWASLGRQETKIDAINVVKVLVDFKVEQSRTDNAERMLGSLVAPLASLNRKLKQIGQKEIAENKLHELVRNRSTVFKRTLPDTFKSLLREYLRDSDAKNKIVNTNTAAFLKANDLISQADVAAASPEAARSAQVLAIDLEKLLGFMEDVGDSDGGYPNVVSSTLSAALKQALADYVRVGEVPHPSWQAVFLLYRKAFERFIGRMAHSAHGMLSGRGVNLRSPHSNIASKQTLGVFKRFVNENRPIGLKPGEFPHGFLRDSHNAAGLKLQQAMEPDWNSKVRKTNLNEFFYEARQLFPPAVFEFPTYWDNAGDRDFRKSQRLAPDVDWGRKEAPYIKNFSELREDVLKKNQNAAFDPAVDLDLLIILSARQTLLGWPNRWNGASARAQASQHPVGRRLQELPWRDQNTMLDRWCVLDSWMFPTDIRFSSREVDYILIEQGPITIANSGGPSDDFYRSKTFTVRYSWSLDHNFVQTTFVDDKPWIVRYEQPHFHMVNFRPAAARVATS
jgi:hypothetical protein